jgi:polyhydroxyalkanoate synthesis regulator phasin
VQCGDGLVLIKRVSVDGKEVNPSSYFKVGRRLGMLVEKEIVSLKERIEELEKIVQELQKKLKVRNSV